MHESYFTHKFEENQSLLCKFEENINKLTETDKLNKELQKEVTETNKINKRLLSIDEGETKNTEELISDN